MKFPEEPYFFRIARNYSFNTICSAVLVDRIKGPRTFLDDKKQVWLGGLSYSPPKSGPTDIFKLSSQAKAANDLWSFFEEKTEFGKFQKEYRLLAYRVAIAENAPKDITDDWRWRLSIWNQADRQEFRETMSRAWTASQDQNPDLRLKKFRKYSPGTVESN